MPATPIILDICEDCGGRGGFVDKDESGWYGEECLTCRGDGLIAERLLVACLPCLREGPDHGPFHDDGTVNEAGTQKWLDDGNQFPFRRGEVATNR